MRKARIGLLMALILLAGASGLFLAQLRGEVACFDAGGSVVGGHSTCAKGLDEWPLHAPYALYASLGVLAIVGPWAVHRTRG